MSNYDQKAENLARWLRIGLLLLGAAVVGAGIFHFLKQKKHEDAQKAFSLLLQAEKLEELARREASALAKPVAQKDPKAKIEPEAEVPALQVMVNWGADKRREYEEKLQSVMAAHPKSAAASIAGLKLGRFYFFTARYTEARSAYQKVIDTANGGDLALYKAMAFEGLGSAWEGENKWDEALKAFEQAGAFADNPLKPLAYFGQARALRRLGKAADAKNIYKKVIQDFPQTAYERRAKALMALEG